MSAASSSSGWGRHTSSSSASSKGSRSGGSVQHATGSNSTSTSTGSTRKTKCFMVCEVCRDQAKSMHFGGVSCDSCKAFFRRSVQNKTFPTFSCTVGDGNCEINMSSRKSCQFCRFEKCLKIGMEKKWVMNEEERGALVQQRKEKKRKGDDPELPHGPKGSVFEPSEGSELVEESVDTSTLTMEEKSEIELLVHRYRQAQSHVPYNVPLSPDQTGGSRDSVEIVQMFTTMLRRIVFFYKGQPEFTNLPLGDQTLLLKGSVLEICLLRSAVHYDFSVEKNCWKMAIPDRSNEISSSSSSSSSSSASSSSCQSNSNSNETASTFLDDTPLLQLDDIKKLISVDLFEMHIKFMKDIQSLKTDEWTVTLLANIVLFCSDRQLLAVYPLQAPEQVAQIQDKYLRLLKNYLNFRYGLTHGKWLFPKLLAKLSDLRQLNDFHTDFNLRLERNQVEMIRESLSNMAM